MTSSAFPATWLPAAIARAAIVSLPAAQTVPTGRHRAPQAPGAFSIATPEDVVRTGRHAEPEWNRELVEPERDGVDSLNRLGFADRP